MTADVVQARYDNLDSIAARFGHEATAGVELQKRVARCVEALEKDGWQGRGADAFFAEMHGVLYPAMQRMTRALEEARSVTLEVKNILRAAEEEASGVFGRDRQITGPGGSGGSGGGGADGNGDAGGRGGFGDLPGPFSKQELKGEYKFYQIDLGENKGHNPRDLGFKYAILTGDLGSKSAEGSGNLGPLKTTGMVKASLVDYEAGIGVVHSKKDGLSVGAYGEVYAAKVKAEGVVGDQQLGVTGDVGAKGPGGELFVGYRNGEIGAKIGGSLVSADGDVGVNVAGANVGLHGEIGLKAELGFKIGKKTEVELPFITLGISFGTAKDGKAD